MVIDPPLTYDTIEVEAPTHLALVADIADRPVSDIRELNPSLLTSVAPAGYQLHVPEGAKTTVAWRVFRQSLPQRRASWRIHRVGPGDTMESIARRYNMPVNSIASLNNQSDAEIGDVLIIPTASQVERLQDRQQEVDSQGVRRKPRRSRREVSSSKRESSEATRNAGRMASAYVSGGGLN